jgi:hypothetical protein
MRYIRFYINNTNFLLYLVLAKFGYAIYLTNAGRLWNFHPLPKAWEIK